MILKGLIYTNKTLSTLITQSRLQPSTHVIISQICFMAIKISRCLMLSILILQIFTNGIYRSIEHRGVVSPDKERISIATFHSPKIDAELGPATSLITPQTSPKFKRISVADFYRLFFKCKLDGKSRIESLRVANDYGDKNYV